MDFKLLKKDKVAYLFFSYLGVASMAWDRVVHFALFWKCSACESFHICTSSEGKTTAEMSFLRHYKHFKSSVVVYPVSNSEHLETGDVYPNISQLWFSNHLSRYFWGGWHGSICIFNKFSWVILMHIKFWEPKIWPLIGWPHRIIKILRDQINRLVLRTYALDYS